jgi:hypothetical protein
LKGDETTNGLAFIDVDRLLSVLTDIEASSRHFLRFSMWLDESYYFVSYEFITLHWIDCRGFQHA